MKLRSVFLAACFSVPLTSLFAGGIVTNTNQSASWTRNPSTAATLGTEAVYYNPAATALLGPGLSFSISNQSVFQKREIENFYSGLNQNLYKGTVNAPVFPSIYAAYNLNKFSFSFGFNPIGGGGSAEFKKGLPSFELPLADMVKTFQSGGATGYSLDAYFKGSSIYFGYQFGVAYKINDNISVFGGLRYITAKNTYEGYLRDINLVTGSGSYAPSEFMTNLAATLNAGSNALNGYATNVGSIATALGSATTFNDAIALTAGNPTLQGQITALRDGLTSLGVQNAGSLTLAAGQANFAGAATGYANSASQITSQIPGATVLTADQEADVEQTGSGICPIVGVNLSLMESKLNIGLKYEFATKMEVKNKTSKDVITGFDGNTPVTMFPDGAKIPADMPAMLSAGVAYKITDKLSVSSSLYYFFDKSVEYGKKLPNEDGDLEYVKNDKVIDGNFIDWALGAEYQLTDKLLVSTGYLFGKQDVKQTFQSDLNYSISSHTYCIGGKYSISPKFDVNLGLSWSKYEKGKKHAAFSKTYPNEIALETYMKDTFIVGIGVDIKLSK